MTRKHYRKFAEMLLELRRASNAFDNPVLVAIENGLIIICKDDNPRFNAERFRKAARGIK